MTELSQDPAGAIYDWPHTNITPAELAALQSDPHAGSTRRHDPGECERCMEVFRSVRRYLAAARPVIEKEYRVALMTEHERALEHERGMSYEAGFQEGYGRGRDDEAAGLPSPDDLDN